MVPVEELDDIIWHILASHLEQCTDFDAYAQEEKEHARQTLAKELQEIDVQIVACETAMDKLQKKLRLVDDPDLITSINADYKRYKEEKERQRQRRDAVTNPDNLYAEKMVTYRELVTEFKEHRQELATIEELRLVIDTFVTALTMDAQSPSVYRIDITWRDTRWGKESVLCVRDNPAQPRWTEKEEWLLRLRYPTNPFSTLVKYFPNRSIVGICSHASDLKIERRVQDRHKPFDIHLCLQDYTLFQQYPALADEKFIRLC